MHPSFGHLPLPGLVKLHRLSYLNLTGTQTFVIVQAPRIDTKLEGGVKKKHQSEVIGKGRKPKPGVSALSPNNQQIEAPARGGFTGRQEECEEKCVLSKLTVPKQCKKKKKPQTASSFQVVSECKCLW